MEHKAPGNDPVAVSERTTAVLGKKDTLIALPWLKQTNPLTAFSVMGLVDRRRSSIMLNYGDAFVAHSRNRCADMFLRSEKEWMLTIDDDMVVPFGHAQWFNGYAEMRVPEPFASFNALDRLRSHGKTLIGGLYFGKHPTGPPMYNEGASNAQERAYARKAPYDLIKPTRWVATGCMLVHRSVFLDIEKRFPLLARNSEGLNGQWFTTSEHTLTDAVQKVCLLLEDKQPDQAKVSAAYRMLRDAQAEAKAKSSLGMGEDVVFCIRAKEAGHQPYVDLGLVCGHVGSRVFGPHNTHDR